MLSPPNACARRSTPDGSGTHTFNCRALIDLEFAQKLLHILGADASHLDMLYDDASCLAALQKLGICLICLRFRALPGRRLNA
jgi:hypothetical protein